MAERGRRKAKERAKAINIQYIKNNKTVTMEHTKIYIPKPCNESWDNMTPENGGRYCGSCKKTVVDFTAMETEQIKNYFKNRETEKICGHFKSIHVNVHRPKHHQFLINLHKKIERNFSLPFFKTVALSMIALCMTIVGCNSESATGEKALRNTIDTVSNIKPNTLMGDTVVVAPTDTNEVLSGEVCIKKK
jgi:hypothetical protein